MSALPTALEQFEALARKQGWRLEWRTTEWPAYHWNLRVLDIFAGPDRVGGAASTFRDDENRVTEALARLVLSRP